MEGNTNVTQFRFAVQNAFLPQPWLTEVWNAVTSGIAQITFV